MGIAACGDDEPARGAPEDEAPSIVDCDTYEWQGNVVTNDDCAEPGVTAVIGVPVGVECPRTITLRCSGGCIGEVVLGEDPCAVDPGDEPPPEPEGIFLRAGCVAAPIAELDAEGRLACSVVEVNPLSSAACDCGPGRRAASAELGESARAAASRIGACPTDDSTCAGACVCEFVQAEGDALTRCQEDPAPLMSGEGYCLVDVEAGFGNPELVPDCAVGERRTFRFADPPLPMTLVWTDCQAGDPQ